MKLGILITPVGLNLFFISGITGRSIGWAIKFALPWLGLLLTFLVMVRFTPQILLCLPEYIVKLHRY